MTTVSIEQAQAQLPGLIAGLKPGEELLITEQDRPVARLVAERQSPPKPRRPGSAVGKLTVVEDDGGYLDDFGEYLR